MLKRIVILVISLIFTFSSFTACSDQNSDSRKKNAKILNLTIGPEPETIDSALNSSNDGMTYITHFFEGLICVDKNDNPIAGTADKWEVSADKTKYKFHIRNKAKWSDGKAVKAQDYEYAWKRILNPKTASPYSTMLYYLKNGKEYNNGKVNADEVGVKAIDDRTLEITLKAPVVYFLSVLTHHSYMPVRKDIIEKYGDKWTQSPKSYVSNGAYKMKAWKHKDVLKMVKNKNYWNTKNIKIKEINWKLIEDDNAALNAYESGELDGVLNRHVPINEIKRLTDEGKIKFYPMLSNYYVDLSINKKPVDNIKLRKALSLAIDRKLLVNSIIQTGGKPAVGVVPYSTKGAEKGKDFRSEKEAKKFLKPTADVKAAKKLLKEAGYPNGKGLAGLEYIYNTASNHQKVAEFLQEQWKKNLGIEVKISNMEWKTIIPKRQAHDFIMARAGWAADYNDPMTFLEYFVQGDGNNDPDYNNENYNTLIEKAKLESDNQKRMQYLHEAEATIMNDMPIIPLFFDANYQLESKKLKGMVTSNLSIYYLHYATFK